MIAKQYSVKLKVTTRNLVFLIVSLYSSLCFSQHRALLRARYNKKCSLSYCLSLCNSLCFLQHRALLRPVQINTTCIITMFINLRV